MIPIDDAAAIILAHCPAPTRVEMPLLDALGFALARELTADADVPPFPRAMMDGFAVIAADTLDAPARLRVVDTLPAGTAAAAPLHRGTAAQDHDRRPLPPGADAVQKKEVCRELDGDAVEVLEPIAAGRHVAAPGSEFPAGAMLFEPGHVLSPSDLGVLAIFGHARVPVFRKPSLRLINTGSELVDVDQPLHGGKIRNSNLYSIASFYRANGFACEPLASWSDEPEPIRAAIRSAADRFDVVLLTGGVSVGEFDLVQAAVRAEGYEVLVEPSPSSPASP